MLHARIVRSPFPHAGIGRGRRIGASPKASSPSRRTTSAGSAATAVRSRTNGARDRSRAVRGRPRRGRRRRDRRATPRRRSRSIEVEYEEIPAVLDVIEAALTRRGRSSTSRSTISDNDAAYFGIRPEPGTNVCHRFRIAPRRRGRRPGPGRTSSSRRRTGPPPPSTRPMEPHATRRALGWRPARAVDRHADAVQRARGRWRASSGFAEEHVRVVCPPMGGSFGAKTFVRLEAIDGGARAEGAAGPCRLRARRATEEWLTHNRHPARRSRCGSARSADGTLVAKRTTCLDRHRRLRGLRAGRGESRSGYAVVGPVPDPEREGRVSLRLHEHCRPNGAFRGFGAMQAVWASERAMDTARRPAADSTRSSFACRNLLQRRRHVLHRRD